MVKAPKPKRLTPEKWFEQADFVRSLRQFMSSPETLEALAKLATRLEEIGEERKAQDRPKADAPKPKAASRKEKQRAKTEEEFKRVRLRETAHNAEKTQRLRSQRHQAQKGQGSSNQANGTEMLGSVRLGPGVQANEQPREMPSKGTARDSS